MTDHEQDIQFMLITASPEVAVYAESKGVSRIFVDQETLGKQERQGHLNTHKAAHTADDIRAVASVIKKAELMVRVNPLNPKSKQEIDTAIECGCHRLMLPMFNGYQDVDDFLHMVNKRVPVTFLAETPQSLTRLSDWLVLLKPGFDEVHIGLNDLTLGLGLKFLFEPLAGRLLDMPSQILNESGITWGFGGLAQIGKGELAAEFVVGEHVRMGSNRAILSRAFHQGTTDVTKLDQELKFGFEIERIREAERTWRNASRQELIDNQKKLADIAFRLGRG